MVHVLNAPSPAATASLSIGKTIAGFVKRIFSFLFIAVVNLGESANYDLEIFE